MEGYFKRSFSIHNIETKLIQFIQYIESLMELFNEIKQLVEEAELDAIKFYERGNKAAGVRLRKTMQEIKGLAQDLRLEVNEVRLTRENEQ